MAEKAKTEEDKRVNISIYVYPKVKEAVEGFFLDCRLKNFQEGYRDIFALGFEEYKKLKKVKGGK